MGTDTDVPSFVGQPYYLVAQIIAGVAMVYIIIAAVLAWLLGGLTLYNCFCVLFDFFFTAAFIAITLLMWLDPFCTFWDLSGVLYPGCSPRKRTFIAPSIAA